jgi:intein-encoded DNA endonuclease-like protein
LKGDGCLANRKRSHYFIDLQVKDKDFTKTFAEALSKVLNENVTFKRLRRAQQEVYLTVTKFARDTRDFIFGINAMNQTSFQ